MKEEERMVLRATGGEKSVNILKEEDPWKERIGERRERDNGFEHREKRGGWGMRERKE